MAGQVLPCKYEPDHGTFPSPIQLGAHYRAAHPEHLANDRRVKCPAPRCYAKLTPENLAKHMADQHGPKGKALVPAKPVKPKPDWHPDQIVIPVVGELIGDAVPLDKLPTVFRWREATAQMLEELQ